MLFRSDRNETKHNNLEFGENVIIVKVTKDGAAFGKLKENDIVQKLDGEIVRHTNFATIISQLAPGTVVKMEVLRDGKVIEVEIELMERPKGP